MRKTGQPRAKRQSVTAEIRAGAIQLTYVSNVRRVGDGVIITKTVWVVEVRLLDTTLDPWVLITEAVRIFQIYRQRWSVETASNLARSA